jgi:fanconi anemia group J protein
MQGSISEGLDTGGAASRGVVCVGLPFPSLKDPVIVEKRRFNDEAKQQDETRMGGAQWYQQVRT